MPSLADLGTIQPFASSHPEYGQLQQQYGFSPQNNLGSQSIVTVLDHRSGPVPNTNGLSIWSCNLWTIQLPYYFKFANLEFNKFLLRGNGWLVFDNDANILYNISNQIFNNPGYSSSILDGLKYENYVSYVEQGVTLPNGLTSITPGAGYEGIYPFWMQLAIYGTAPNRTIRLRVYGQSNNYNKSSSYPYPQGYDYTTVSDSVGGFYSDQINFVQTYDFPENGFIRYNLDRNIYSWSTNPNSNYQYNYPSPLYGYAFTAMLKSVNLKKRSNNDYSNFFDYYNYSYPFYDQYSGMSAQFGFKEETKAEKTMTLNRVETYGFGEQANWANTSMFSGANYNILPFDKTNPTKYVEASAREPVGIELPAACIVDIDMSKWTHGNSIPIVFSKNIRDDYGSYMRIHFKNLDLPKNTSITVFLSIENQTDSYAYLYKWPVVNGVKPIGLTYGSTQWENSYNLPTGIPYSSLIPYEISNVSDTVLYDYYGGGSVVIPENSYKVAVPYDTL